MKKSVWGQIFSFAVLVLFLSFLPCVAHEAPPLKTDAANQELIAELERQIPELMAKADIPGMSIAVIKDGKIIWTEGFGIKNTKTGEAAAKDTVFEAASLTGKARALVER